jgi:hypothetical protein
LLNVVIWLLKVSKASLNCYFPAVRRPHAWPLLLIILPDTIN